MEAKNMKAKILIVDNESDIRMMLKSTLANSFTVTEADSGAALKKLLAGEGPERHAARPQPRR